LPVSAIGSSAIGFGLGAALYGAITLKDGQVEQSNFDGYQVLRIDDMPKVEVHIVPSTEAPTGVGEPGVAPIGPVWPRPFSILDNFTTFCVKAQLLYSGVVIVCGMPRM
jgi:hypothetical protein